MFVPCLRFSFRFDSVLCFTSRLSHSLQIQQRGRAGGTYTGVVSAVIAANLFYSKIRLTSLRSRSSAWPDGGAHLVGVEAQIRHRRIGDGCEERQSIVSVDVVAVGACGGVLVDQYQRTSRSWAGRGLGHRNETENSEVNEHERGPAVEHTRAHLVNNEAPSRRSSGGAGTTTRARRTCGAARMGFSLEPLAPHPALRRRADGMNLHSGDGEPDLLEAGSMERCCARGGRGHRRHRRVPQPYRSRASPTPLRFSTRPHGERTGTVAARLQAPASPTPLPPPPASPPSGPSKVLTQRSATSRRSVSVLLPCGTSLPCARILLVRNAASPPSFSFCEFFSLFAASKVSSSTSTN